MFSKALRVTVASGVGWGGGGCLRLHRCMLYLDFFLKKNYLRYYLEALEVFIYALSSEKMNVTLDFVILVE